MSADDVLTIWVIYKSPRDYPGQYVLRAQDVVRGDPEPRPRRECIVRPSLEEVRHYVRHLYRMDRHALDEPTIVETWF